VAYQEAEANERVSFRLGEGDVTYEIIQRLEYGESVEIEVTNLGDDANLHVTYMQLQASLPAMGEGEIDWDKLVEDSGGELLVNPGSSTVITIEESYIWHLLFIHNPSDSGQEVMEVRVMNEYEDDSMLSAFLLSIPSLWITGFVIHRLVRLKISEQPLISSLPSHKWNGSEE